MRYLPNHDLLDVVALVWFFLCWIGFPLYSDRIGKSRGNLLGLMAQQREDWMTRMFGRDNRMVDIVCRLSLAFEREHPGLGGY